MSNGEATSVVEGWLAGEGSNWPGTGPCAPSHDCATLNLEATEFEPLLSSHASRQSRLESIGWFWYATQLNPERHRCDPTLILAIGQDGSIIHNPATIVRPARGFLPFLARPFATYRNTSSSHITRRYLSPPPQQQLEAKQKKSSRSCWPFNVLSKLTPTKLNRLFQWRPNSSATCTTRGPRCRPGS